MLLFLYILHPLANFHSTLLACFSHTTVSLSSFHLSFFPLSFHTSLSLTSFLSPLLSHYLSQGLSQCHMTNGTTTSRPGYAMQWLSLLRQPLPWYWIEGHTPCRSQAASGHLTRRAQTPDTPRKYWSELAGWCAYMVKCVKKSNPSTLNVPV